MVQQFHPEWAGDRWSGLALRSGEAQLYAMTKSGSSAQWRNQHGQRLWRELDWGCEIRLHYWNRHGSQRWLGRSVPTYQVQYFCGSSQRSRMGISISK